MADIFDQVAGGGTGGGGDIFDQVQYQAPVQQPQPQMQQPQQPDIFDQVQYQPQETQLDYGRTVTPAQPQIAMAAPKPGQPLQAGVQQENWFDQMPIVQDFRQAAAGNDWGNFWGSAIKGVPAGPLELGDMFGNIARYSQDLGMQAGKAMFAPREVQNLPPFLQDMIDQGLEQSISPIRIPKFDMAGAYKNLMQPKMPGAFGGGAFVGQALLPIGNVRAGATIGQKLGQAALGGAAMSGIYDAGQQYQKTGQINPIQTAGSVALGGGIGALGAGAVHGLEKGMGALRARYAPPPQAQAPQATWNPQKIAQFFGQVSPEADDAMAAMATHGGPGPMPAVRPQVNTPEQALAQMEQMRIGNKAIDSLRNLAHEAEIPSAPARPAARLRGQVQQQAQAEQAPLDFKQVRQDIEDAIKNAKDHGELDSVTEDIAKFIKGNVTSNEVRKSLHNVVKDARRERVREIGTQGRPALDQAVDDVQNAGPEDAEKAVENWAKQALGIDADALGKQVSEDVPAFFHVDELEKLVNRERQQFPDAFREHLWLGKRKLQTLSEEANGFIPAALSDEELAAMREFYDIEAARTVVSRTEKKKIKEAVKGLTEEYHRREQRKALGIPQDTSAMKDIRALTDDELDRVIQGGTEKQQMQAIDELTRRHSGAKVDYQPGTKSDPIKGDFGRPIENNMKGRNKNKLAVDVHDIPAFNQRPVKLMLRKYGDAKIRKDYDEARLKSFVAGVAKKFAKPGDTELELPGGGKIKIKVDDNPTPDSKELIEAAREKYAIGTEETKSPVIATMLSKYFGDSPDKLPYQRVAVPDTLEEVAQLHNQLYGAAKKSERAYDELKPSFVRKQLEQAEKTLANKRDQSVSAKSEKARNNAAEAVAEYENKVEDLSRKLKEAVKNERVLESLEKDYQDYTGDFTSQINVKLNSVHPENESIPVEFAVEFKKGTKNFIIDPKREADLAAEVAEIKAADLNRPRKKFWVTDGNTMRKAAPAVIGGSAVANFFTGVAAQAADLSGKAAVAAGPDMFQALNTVPMGEMAAAAAFLRLAAPKLAKQILTNENLKIGVLWKDTMDNVEYLSKMGAVHPDLKKTILNHTAQTLKASWGVAFDQEEKALMLGHLREKNITAKELIEGASSGALETKEHKAAIALAETFTQEQRNALACYSIAQDSLKKVIRGEVKRAQEFQQGYRWKDGEWTPPAEGAAIPAPESGLFFKEGVNSLNYIADQLSPRGGGNWLDNLASHARSNFMDAAFFWNPEFHGTNLTDSFIAGGSFTGPINMLRAWKLMAHDQELRKIFHNSNLIGGYKADRIAETVIQGKAKKPLINLKDIDSDMFNANRLTLSTLLQYAQRNKAGLAAEGFKGSDVDFAKAVLTGSAQISDELGMDAFRHVADTLSQVMGVDNFRLNTDILSRSQFGKQAAVFFKQPARIARLAMNYAANGDMKGLYWLMGATAVLGGSAAVPTDVATGWQIANPESYFKMAHALDQVDLYAKVSGQKLTPKIQWTLAWLMNTGSNPVLGDVQEALGGMIVAAYKNDPEKFLKAVEKSVPYAMPRVGGVPTRMLMTGKKTVDQMNQKSYKSYVETDPITKQPDFKKTLAIPFSKLGRHPLVHFANQYIPGKEPSDYQHKMQAQEQMLRQSRGQRVPPNSQFYPPQDIYNQPSPLDSFFGVPR